METGSDLVLVADARIDNRRSLIRALGLDEGRERIITDAGLILLSYRQWGADCAEHLIGDFAFALWDGRAQQVFCARDPVGVRPLYYYVSESLFACASEIGALHRIEGVPRGINEKQIARFLAARDQRGEPDTFYEKIFRLAPGSMARISPDDTRFQSYWSVDPEREIDLESDEAYIDAFREHFREAVGSRMRSTQAPSVRLSGGVDSSTVACMMRNLRDEHTASQGPIKTFTYVYPGVPEEVAAIMDERDYVDDVLVQGGFEPHFLEADKLNPVEHLEEVVACIEQPHRIDNLYTVWSAFELIASHSTRAVLDGSEGDVTLTHGHAHLRWLARTGRWEELSQHARARARNLATVNPDFDPDSFVYTYGSDYLRGLAAQGRWLEFITEIKSASAHFGVSGWQLARDHHVSRMLPSSMRRFLRLGQQQEASVLPDSILNREFAADVGVALSSVPRQETDRAVPQRTAHAAAFNSGGMASVLEIFDKIAARNGLTHRHPFWDRRLIEFCVGLPPDQIIRNGWGRWILREAMEDILPPSIQWRPDKANLGPNFVQNFQSMGASAIASLFDDSGRIWHFVDRQVLKEVYEQLKEESGYTVRSVVMSRTLWRVLALKTWLDSVRSSSF